MVQTEESNRLDVLAEENTAAPHKQEVRNAVSQTNSDPNKQQAYCICKLK